MGAISVEMRECAADSTMHGLPKVAKRNPGFIRVLWLLICMLATVFMVMHFSTLLDRFMHTPVTTSFAVNASSRSLPTISLCAYTFSLSSLEALLMHTENISDADEVSKTDIYYFLRKHSAEGGLKKAFVRNSPEKFIVGCSINEMDCSTSSSWRLIGDIGKFRCFRLDASVDLTYQNPTKIDLYMYVDSSRDKHNELREKLDDALDYDATVYLHMYSSYETCIQPPTGLPITAGCMHDINLRSSSFIQMPLPVAEMGMPKCNIEKPQQVRYCDEQNNLAKESPHLCFEDARLCFANRLQEIALRECNETSRYHEQNFLVGCPLVAGLNSHKTANQKNVTDNPCLANILNNNELINRIAVQCTPCEDTKWKDSVRYSTWPKEEAASFVKREGPANLINYQTKLKTVLTEELGFTPTNVTHKVFDVSQKSLPSVLIETYRKHAAYVRFEIDLDVDMMVEELAYPFTSFMGEVGGIMGLWLGCSVITFLEPLEIVLRLLVNLSKRKQSTPLKADGN